MSTATEKAPVYSFRVRVEFDVEVSNPSHIDAAFAAAEWLEERAEGGRLSHFVYDTASHIDLKDGNGTQFVTTDLEDLMFPEDETEEAQR